jgi:protein-disulfide isomerase
MKEGTSSYRTHWHSFWFGFMCALAIVLFALLIFTVTDRITFKNISSKKAPIAKTTTEEGAEQPLTSLTAVVESLGLNAAEIQQCAQNDEFAQEVENDIASGTAAGVKGTPHSFVLIDNAVYEIPGAYEESGMREFFDDLLAGNEPRATDISATTELAPVDESDWIRGSDDARITVIEYSDIDCPYCKQFHTAITNMMEDYRDDVRWVFRHMPIDALHPTAREKAETAECIGASAGAEKFWEYIDRIFHENI